MIRFATIADLETIADIDAVSFAAESWPLERFAADLISEHRKTFLADGGFAMASVLGEDLDLERIAVRPELRRSKIATEILDEIIKFGQHKGVERIILDVSENNLGAQRFYAQMGFVEITRRLGYYPGGIDALVMTKEITRGKHN